MILNMSSISDQGERSTRRESNPNQVRLTPEERLVMLRCRRAALIKGTLSVLTLCGTVYWLRAQGRGPVFVKKLPGLTYSIGSLVAFTFGVGDIKRCVVSGVLVLDNSPLADRYRESMRKSQNQGSPAGIIRPPKEGKKPDQLPPYKESVQQRSLQSRPPVQPRSPEFKDGPAINSHIYNKDKSMLDTGPKESDETNQPDAFGNFNKPSSLVNDLPETEQPQKGRTFDEIREEHRRRRQHSQSNSNHSYSDNPHVSGNTKKKRYNKFGDEIED